MELVGRAAVELEVPGARGNIHPRLLDGLAAIACFDECQLLGPIDNGARERVKQTSLVRGRERAPGAVERRSRSPDGDIDVGGIAARDCRKWLAFGGIDHRQRGARCRCDPAVGDEIGGRRGRHGPGGMRRVHDDSPDGFEPGAAALLRGPELVRKRIFVGAR